MPDRELPEDVRRRLSAALESGAPLIAPMASQARFAISRGAMPAPRWRLRALTVAAAVAGIVVVALAGPPQTREWVVQSVNGISKQVGLPAGAATPSPKEEPTTSGENEPSAPTQSPENHEGSPEPAGSPQPSESPDGDDTPQPAQPQSSPTPQPSDGGGGGSDGGGDQSPEPSPSSGN
jgi:hypothetical protein